MIPIVGIIGGIGSGKSVVADAMHKLGGHVIRGDQLGHDALLQPDLKAKLHARWGDGILDAHGNPDRKMVGRLVFSSEAELRFLESVVFPVIEKKIVEQIDAARAAGDVPFIVLDAAIMVETGWHRRCDKLIFVDAPRDLRLARLKESRGWDDAELTRREKMQLPLDEKKRRADAVIVNDGDLEKVSRQVQESLLQLKVI